MKLTYYLKELKTHYRDQAWCNERLAKRIGARYFSYKQPGMSIWEEDWDNLIILDACRYDLFKELYEASYSEPVYARISLGSSTAAFLENNFPLDDYEGLIYVTANPYVDRILKGRGVEIVRVWDTGWDDVRNTVTPESVYEAALEVVSRQDDNKIIVHFLQPHYPYPQYDMGINFKRAMEEMYRDETGNEQPDPRTGKRVIWPLYCWRKSRNTALYEGYRENLELVLPFARKLADFLPGRTVITSDHGEALGERMSPLFPLRFYGHHAKMRMKCTVTVPRVLLEPEDKRPGNLEDELRQTREQSHSSRDKPEKERLRRHIADLRRQGRI